MTLTRHSSSALVVDTKTSTEDWAVVEHHAVLQENEPPTIVMVTACKLVDVYRLADGKVNSEWAKIFRHGGQVMVQIVATTDEKTEAFKHAQERIRDIVPTPVCNMRGHSLKTARRAIICHQNERRYNSQAEAAADLGIHAPSISRQLNGHARQAQGFTFAYAAPEE